MKYVIFSDLHLHSWAGEVDKETRLSKKLLVQKDILQQVIDLSVQEEAILLFGGDLVHNTTTLPFEVLNVIDWFFKEIKRCGIKFFSVLGNHDIILRKNCPASHSVLSPFQNRDERDKDLSTMKPSICCVDYDRMDNVEDIKGFDIVLVHAQPDLVNKHKHHMEGVNWKKLTKNNRLVFFGHDHTRRELTKMGYVIGSPMQLTANDIGEDRGCYIVDSENWSVTFHKLDYPEIKKLEKVESKEEVKFEERIKAISFQDILVEWLAHENKPAEYLSLIQSDITDKLQVVKNVFDGKITDVHLKNFMSIDDIEVKLENGFWLVSGTNGSGKTSIFEGIYWTLFDDTTKNLAKPDVVRNRPTQQKEAIGELDLMDSKQFYKIRRSSKTGLEIWQEKKNLVDGMTKVQAQAFLENNILGFNKNTYLAACYFSQEQLLTLAQLGDCDTTNLVTNLLGFETYDALHERMNQKIKEVTLQVVEIEKHSVNIKNDIWKNEEHQKSLQHQIADVSKMVTSLTEEKEKVTIQFTELNKTYDNIIVPSVTTDQIDVSILALNNRKGEIAVRQKSVQEELTKIHQLQARIDKDKSNIATMKRLVEQNVAKHEAIIASLKENKCSYCGAVVEADKMEEHLAKEMAEIDTLKMSVIDNTDMLNKMLEESYDKEAEAQDALDNCILNIREIENEAQGLQSKRNTVLQEVIEANAKKTSITQQLTQVKQRMASIEKQLQQFSVNDKLMQVTDLEDKKKMLVEQAVEVEVKTLKLNDNKIVYEFWANAFSNKGIRPLLLDKFVNDFNKIVLPYCYDVSNGDFVVQFTPTSKIRSGLERNKLGLQVIYKDKTVPYSSLSGGEKTRVNLPLCFGLNKYISKLYNATNGLMGIVVLDELFCYTDEQFRDSVSELLNDEGKNRPVFAIDHSSILTGYTDKMWQISKINDITELQVV